MRSRRPFRPSVSGLETRLAMSHAAAPIAPVDPAYAATGAYTDSFRLVVHDWYAARAARGEAKVLFLGDSITLLWQGQPGISRGTAAWDANFAGLGAANFGILGDQTQNVLWRVENGELAARPRVVVLLVGINDILLGSKTPAGVTAGVADDVKAIRQQSPRTQVLVLGLLPVAYGGFAALENPTNARIAAVVGHQKDVTYLDPGRAFLRPDGTPAPGVLHDDVHPAALGYQILAGQLIGPIKAALRR